MIVEEQQKSSNASISDFTLTNFFSEAGDNETTPCLISIAGIKSKPATYNVTAQFTPSDTDKIHCFLITNKVINKQEVQFKSLFNLFDDIWDQNYTGNVARHIQVELPNCDGLRFEREGSADGDIYGTISIHRIPFNH